MNVEGIKIFWGDILRKLRLQSKLSQAEVAKALHVSRQCYSNIECGKRQPTAEDLAILSELYDIDLYRQVLGQLSAEHVAETNDLRIQVRNIKKMSK